jgi:hypothetical protein
LKTRNRLNHPNRVRTRPHFTSPSATIPTAADYDFTLNPIEAERKSEVSSTQGTLEGATSTKSTEQHSVEQQQPDIVKHRVRLRYKNKLNLKSNSLESGTDHKKKLSGDNQISDSENENVVVRQPIGGEEEFTVATENPFNEIKSSLKLPNLKLRNEALTTIALPTAETHTVSSTSTSSSEHDENVGNNILNKIARPRFSIKELKRKQFLTSSTAPGSSVSTTVLTSSTSSTSPRPDNTRFNRYRLNLHRRRNETNVEATSGEQVESEPPKRRYSSSTRFSVSTSTTESTLTPSPSSTRKALPKRTFPVRNFTKPSSDNSETSTSHKPSFISKNPTNRPRQRIQNYKRKDVVNEIIGEESIKNVNFEYETTIPLESTATTTTTVSTEIPITRETSIMKIAKTQPSHSIKATTSNSITEDDTLMPSLSERHDSSDLVGSPSEHSQRVAELTVSANENSTFKSANIGLLSRRIPNYFTISTDDPILPIQAFFPQIKTNDESVSF